MLVSSYSLSSPYSQNRIKRGMRPGFSSNEPGSPAPMAAVEAIPPAAHAAWRSPVPYLFGGLAAMLGLITFALLVLACSYWKLSGYLERVDSAEHMSQTADSGGSGTAVDGTQEKSVTALEERFVVVMAGDAEKLFLANPIRSRASILAGGRGDEESSAAARIEGDEVAARGSW